MYCIVDIENLLMVGELKTTLQYRAMVYQISAPSSITIFSLSPE